MKRRAFTLIELLVVILIICILLGLLSAAIKKSHHYATDVGTSSDIATLTSAFKVYRHEYGRWPMPGNEDQPNGIVRYKDDNYNVIDLMDRNPKGIKLVNISDYVQNTTNKAVLNKATMSPFEFVFDLDNDSCSVK